MIGDMGAGLAYTGCLAAINQVAPPERKAEMVSAYFVVASLGGLPVVGVGVLAQRTNLFAASLSLAALLAGRPDLIRCPKRVLAHTWEGLLG